jgi:hypothetical protein
MAGPLIEEAAIPVRSNAILRKALHGPHDRRG